MEINFSLLEKEIFNLLDDKRVMVLATSCNDLVTAGSMSCVIIKNKIYFQTDKTFLKYRQILENPNVALCVDNVQVQGVASIKQHPFLGENREFIDKFRERYRSSYDKYSHMTNEVVIEVEPTFIVVWKYENNQPFREFLDIRNHKAYRKNYDITV
ncbi:MAG: pyridoxamine 5'-phosphate oxidase family protein [Clostridium sp.]|jgi:uncharacterized pyridoxamine 5'-phosphate oxidase family protein|uniref:pyridoxamine 5'-phosphate oxidase family protein n=1 Tax=Clostridium sp. TaxID=1506 RepID=UPI0025C57CCD|nr:pyridoxamine 5'-phosphate oxidase family protein [Clostridium sp.]MCH3963354.1 pyridoxamine 5'-phosphate oxidase family protein [Clostridium sp.]MCI1716778.1 pyridoxamine 5'-phosphate oxidase family protein [Clostridium sp.]MCI1801038.1 pyridoxamine 5'-phosphate oxidase family protein [Clostridium sp.]MCI1814964.1 pyridoxamine 5'-phosphate oxidase family protein [Clostridium sp.]MCI1871865.1 pyridoxamine 5'-phosphate oxidase family protein [Clostridium sp.]